LTPQEEAHARSIGDTQVALAPIPPAKVPRILVGSVVRKRPEIVRAYLDC
jgi:hypothetical protein